MPVIGVCDGLQAVIRLAYPAIPHQATQSRMQELLGAIYAWGIVRGRGVAAILACGAVPLRSGVALHAPTLARFLGTTAPELIRQFLASGYKVRLHGADFLAQMAELGHPVGWLEFYPQSE
jgi:hypothetical protein